MHMHTLINIARCIYINYFKERKLILIFINWFLFNVINKNINSFVPIWQSCFKDFLPVIDDIYK